VEWISLPIVYKRHLQHVKIKTMDKPGYLNAKKAGSIIASPLKGRKLRVSLAAEAANLIEKETS
jgi:hypothetical protein